MWGLRVGLPEQYSPGAIFPSGKKLKLRLFVRKKKRAAEAKARFEARRARLEREKAARLERHKSAAVQPAAKDKDAIAAALARVKEKQAQGYTAYCD